MARQTAKKRRTLIKIAVKKTGYAAGTGAQSVYETIQAKIAENPDGSPVFTDCFYCEWLNSFGSVALQAQQEKVRSPARVRMTFVQSVYDALQTKDVKIFKFGKEADEYTYTVNTSADNYLEESQLLEFHVKRYEGK